MTHLARGLLVVCLFGCVTHSPNPGTLIVPWRGTPPLPASLKARTPPSGLATLLVLLETQLREDREARCARDSTPLTHALVTLRRPDLPRMRGANVQGSSVAQLDSLLPGTYTLVVQALGFESTRGEVRLKKNKAAAVVVRLQPPQKCFTVLIVHDNESVPHP